MSTQIITAIQTAIEEAIDASSASVQGGDGHYTISVTARAFEGKTTLQKQRLVYSAIAHLMKGDGAPVHAVDKLETLIG